ncbi:MAG: T9SS type A sorting domain-containing protein, partial [Nitrososphaerota archaeon]|nr:T9SS type A sorting domain-containing protein [Nitrososphaerota archaeon]
ITGYGVFAGTASGIYKSTNDGETWKNVSSVDADCFATQGTKIFAGTVGHGVLRSTDGGQTWIQVDTSFNRIIKTLAVKDSMIFAGGYGMFRSTDDGSSWTTMENGLQGYYGLTITGFAMDGSKLYATSSAGLLLSTDDGDNWANLTSNALPEGQANCIAIDDTTIIVGTPGGMVRSTDDGISWYKDNTGLPTTAGFYIPVLSLAVDGNLILAGTSAGLYVSSDSGASWFDANNGLPGNQVWSLAESGATLFAATESSGVYRSSNNGTSWTPATTGIILSEVNSITGDSSYVYASIQGSLFLSTDNGTTWTANTSLKSASVRYVKVIGASVYAIGNTGVSVSSDNGGTWNTINDSLDGTIAPSFLVESGSNLIVAYYDTGKVFLSSDNGATWKNVGRDLPEVASLATTGSNVIAGSRDGMYLSTDHGETWTNVDDTLININTIAVDGPDIFAGRYHWPYSDLMPPTPPGGVFRSTDGGLTWSSYDSRIPFDPQVYAVAVRDEDVFAGSSPGLYVSTVTGNNWVNVGENLPAWTVLSLFVGDSSVFAGMERGGIWRAPLSEVTAIEQPAPVASPQSFQLGQNYPNPFNPTTTISYQLKSASHVTLKIYDVLGREVTTLVNKKQDEGYYAVRFDGTKLASGVYFYQINVRGDNGQTFVSTRKALLLK